MRFAEAAADSWEQSARPGRENIIFSRALTGNSDFLRKLVNSKAANRQPDCIDRGLTFSPISKTYKYTSVTFVCSFTLFHLRLSKTERICSLVTRTSITEKQNKNISVHYDTFCILQHILTKLLFFQVYFFTLQISSYESTRFNNSS